MENGTPREQDQNGRDSGRDETEEERLDRNLSELLQELRVALPGVQVLFAFLLAVPFQQGFEKITGFQKGAYFGTLVCTAIAAVMLISPSAYHWFALPLQRRFRLAAGQEPLGEPESD
jgi:xanthine/uracil permease